jgi:CubicO group peptidase (beta-lactamase class C family)
LPASVSSFLSTRTAEELRSAFQASIAGGYAAGLVALVGRGAQAEVIAAGTLARDGALPMQRDSIFRIASMTKPVTAAAALILIEEGKLRLDQAIEDFIPELGARMVLKRPDGPLDDLVPARRAITVEDLLTFRLGWGIVLAPPGATPLSRRIGELRLLGFGAPDPASPLTPDAWIERLATLPLMAQPGERFLYNTGSYALGVLIERAAGTPLADFLQERILAPLGMRDTGFFVLPAALHRLVSAYRRGAGGLECYDGPPASAWASRPAFADGGAGLVSTVDDYWAFSRMLLGKGTLEGRRILSAASVERMTTNQLTDAQIADGASVLGAGRSWGYGLSVVKGATPEGVPIGAFGWAGGLGTTWTADPHTGTTAILMTQTLFDSPEHPAIHKIFARTVFGAAQTRNFS